MKRLTNLIALSLCFLTSSLNAQSTFSMGELNPYFSEYLKPMALGMATGMGHGWAHEARPHKILGFDLSLSVVAVQIPEADQTFKVSALSKMTGNGYSFLDANSNPLGNDDLLPTLVSSLPSDATMQKDLAPSDLAPSMLVDVPMMDGLFPEDIAYAPNMALQFALGLPKGTEIMARYVPEVASTINDYANDAGFDEASVNELNMWGIGVKHDIKQWIPVVKRVPMLEISALLAYSEFNFDIGTTAITLNPDELLNGIAPTYTDIDGDGNVPTSGADFNDVGFGMNMSSLTGAVLVGANIPVIRPFIGVGFNKASVSTGLTGNLPMIEYNLNSSDGTTTANVDYDPVGLNVEAEKTFVNFQAGINFKLLIFNFHAQYTYQQYSMISAGLALSIR